MRGAGFLAIWSDVEPKALTDYRHWLTREHTTERVTTKGFLAVRVFRAERTEPDRFFILYELEAPEVLDGPAYLARLNAPTPWSQRIIRPRQILRDVRRRVQFAHQPDEIAHVVRLVGADGAPAAWRAFPLRADHPRRGLAFGIAIGDRRHGIGDQPVSVLDQQVTEIRQPRFGALRFSIQPRVRIGLRRVRLVRPRLAMEIAPIARQGRRPSAENSSGSPTLRSASHRP